MRFRRPLATAGAVLLLLAGPPLHAARISDLTETRLVDQALRFFTFADPSVRYALLGAMLLGVTCGLLGSFIVVRKMALVGDTISHAVLPGVALGYLWNLSKDPLAILIGATVAGLLGTVLVRLIKDTTRLKEDAALGLVLATFFAAGLCLLAIIRRLPGGNKSGLDKFLFGQAAALGPADVQLMAAVTVLAIGAITIAYKEFLVTSFDSQFAQVIGLPARALHHAFMLLLAFAIVIALQAVGVVLVSAMLIIPAATAYLLTNRLHRMLWIAAALGLLAGASGAFASFLGPQFPTGPFMVLSATAGFALAFLFSPRHGTVGRWWRHRSQAARTRRENTLKAIYHVLEAREFRDDGVALTDLALRRRETAEEAARLARELHRHQLATLSDGGRVIHLTPDGWQLACSIVRNHRLWELYLTNAAHFAPDHVHDDAERIEHVLGDETVRQLERRLAFATHDPHGRHIPSLAEFARGPAAPPAATHPGGGSRGLDDRSSRQ